MKKRVLICINEFFANSIGVSLINLLNRLDYTFIDVDLIFVKSQTNMLNQIPSSVNIIESPFDTSKINFFYKLKNRNKYDFSLMYDVGDVKLSEFVINSSKNNALYLHKNYRGIYVVDSTYYNFVNAHAILKFNTLLFSNEKIKGEFIRLHELHADKCKVLEYLVDEKHIQDLAKVGISVDKPNHRTLFVSVGTLNDRAKNFTLMIKMMQSLVKINNHVELWILGDGPDLVNIKMLVKQCGLDDFIKLYGFKNNPYPYMKMADYYLNTADNYDSSTALMEARVLEKPIITTNPADQRENVYVVSPDPNRIANEVNNILVNKVLFKGINNFWEENQHILKKFESLIGR